MKIVVISDTHGDFYELKRVAMRENGADLFLHAGDVESFGGEEIRPFAAVKGNCDYGMSKFPNEYWYMTPYGKLYMKHHPILLKEEVQRLQEAHVKIFIHGHTHIKEARKIGDLYIFCPGSLVYPRDGGSGSYLVLEVEKNGVKATFKTL